MMDTREFRGYITECIDSAPGPGWVDLLNWLADRLEEMPEDALPSRAGCSDCGNRVIHAPECPAGITPAGPAVECQHPLGGIDRNGRCLHCGEQAILLPRTQPTATPAGKRVTLLDEWGHMAREWDRFWRACGCLDGSVSVDDAIGKWQAMERELVEQREEIACLVTMAREPMGSKEHLTPRNRPTATPAACPTCHGAGWIGEYVATGGSSRGCPDCVGTGRPTAASAEDPDYKLPPCADCDTLKREVQKLKDARDNRLDRIEPLEAEVERLDDLLAHANSLIGETQRDYEKERKAKEQAAVWEANYHTACDSVRKHQFWASEAEARADGWQKRHALVVEQRERLRTALEELMQWGVELDDARLKYITVQVDRSAAEAAQEALREEPA